MRRPIVLLKLRDNLATIVRRIRQPKLSRKLVATVASVVILILSLTLAGLLIPGRGSNEQSSLTGPSVTAPSPGNSSYQTYNVVPTNRWMDVHGLESTLDGQPLPVGAVITVRDSEGAVCGEFVVTHAGRYGIMPVYGDDLSTEADEGAGSGDSLQFYVDGIKVAAIGPDAPTWTAMGDLKQVELSISTSH
jgi:hypothetical protein